MPNVPVEIPLPKTWGGAPAVYAEHDISALYNLYPDTSPSGVTALRQLVGVALSTGYTPMSGVASGPVRGMAPFYYNNEWFAASLCNTDLWLVADSASTALVGAVSPGTGDRSGVVASDTQVLVLLNGKLSYSNGTTVAVCSVPSGVVFGGIAFQDGYGLAWALESNSWYISDLDNFAVWQPLQFTTADSSPGHITGIASLNREVWVFKHGATEVYQNTGASPFPFERVQVLNVGCYRQETIQNCRDRLCWLSNDGNVYTATSYTPEIVSSPGVNSRVASADYSWYYEWDGHRFYGLSDNGSGMELDLTTGSWCARTISDTGASHNTDLPITAMCVLPGYDSATDLTSTTLVGTNLSGANIGKLTGSTAYSLTTTKYLLREIVTAPITAGGDRRFAMSEVWVDARLDAVGATAPTATITIETTDTGGDSWTTARPYSIDANEVPTWRPRWTRLGSSRRRHLRFRLFDANTRLTVHGVWARIDTGD